MAQTQSAQPLSAAQMLQAQTNQAPSGPIGALENAGKWVGNAGNSLLSIPIQAGEHLAAGGMELAQPVVRALGFTNEANKIQKNLANQPTTNFTGGQLNPLKPGLSGLEQIAGDTVSNASLLYTPEKTGITGLATLGAIAGGGQSVAAGNGLTSKTTLETAGTGALFGGILGLLGNTARVIKGAQQAATGVDEATQADLAATRPATLSKVINIAVDSTTSHHTPTVSDWLNGELQQGADILDKKVIPQAGEVVGQARTDAANLPVATQTPTGAMLTGGEAVASVKDEVNEMMQQMTGYQFSSYGTGEDSGLDILNYKGASPVGITAPDGSLISQLPGRVAAELEPTEQKSLNWLDKKLNILQENPTVQTASDVVNNLDKNIDWERIQKYGAQSSPIDTIFQRTRGLINHNLIRPAAPALAAANDVFGGLMQTKNALVQGAGNDLQHLDLLSRRALYNGQSGTAQSILDSLFQSVKPYLPAGEESYSTKAILARYARDVYGGIRSKSGLAQGVTSGDVAATASGYTSRVVGAALRFGQRLIAPDPQAYAMSIAKGEPYSFVPFMHHIDEYLDSPSAIPVINTFKNSLKAIGVSSNNVSTVAVQTLKAMLFNNLVHPKAVPMNAAEMMRAQGLPNSTPSLSQ